MTSKELREIARTALAAQIQGTTCDPNIVNASVAALHAPTDADEKVTRAKA